MYCYLLRRCLILIYFCFVIYPKNVSAVNIPIKRDGLKSGYPTNVSTMLSSQSTINEDQIKRLRSWPRGVIQYFIDDFSFDKVLRDKIRTFLEDTSTKTAEALQFVELPYPPKNEQEKWVLFINRVGQLNCADCSLSNFTDRGVQRVLLGYDCLNDGAGGLAAIVLALAGVPPQHNAPNRNDYVAIFQGNILPDKRHLFKIVPESSWAFSSFEYDFASAGHYDFYKYTSNGQATIKPITNVDMSIPVGEATGLSPTDINKISFLYQSSKADLRPNMHEDCSKLYKPGNNIDLTPESDNVEDLQDYDNENKLSNKDGLVPPMGSPMRGSKRGLKSVLEQGTDFDTDNDRG